MLNWRLEQWGRCIFLDEKTYTSNLKYKVTCKRKRGQSNDNLVTHTRKKSERLFFL